jgi:hypothetical protein
MRFHAAHSLLALCALFAGLALPQRLAAQLDTGGITGTVTDPTNAVVPGAKITLTNTETSVAQAMQSTSTGTYDFTGVRPGTYSLRAEKPGFQAFVDDGLLVHVQETLTVDVHFVTGQVTQQVTVTAEAPLLQAENAAVGQTVTTQDVNDLPLQTRDWASLAQLSAGVATATVGNPSGDSGQTSSAFFAVNGVDTWQNDFRLNGINDNVEMYGGSSVGSDAAITPPPDAIQEFKLQSGDADAEFGHSTGAVVNAAVKSGTNSFHGDAWEYWRNDVLNANQFFSGGKRKPEYRQNLFGGTIGGPVRKDKTFFFADYQGGRYITPSPQTDTVPTQNMINSFQSFLSNGTAINLQDLITYNSGTATDALGRVIPHGTILDPATTRQVAANSLDPISGLMNNSSNAVYVRDPFYTGGSIAGVTSFVGKTSQLNILPANRIDPNAVKLLGVYPGPTVANALANNFSYTPREPENTNSYDIRIDENLSSRDVLFGVFDRSYISEIVPSTLPGVAVGEGGGRHDSFPAYAWAVGYNHIFAPTLINELHVGMVHSDKLQESNFGDTFGIPAQYGIAGIPQVANNGGIPPTTINGLTHIGVGNFTPTLQYVYSVEVADNLTKELGSHTFKMGVQIDDIYGNISQPPQGRGDLNFNGQYTDIPNQNSSLTGIGDLLLIPIASTVGGPNLVGGMSSFSGSNIAATVDRRWYTGAYFQDDWKLTPRLTLNLGLRWDYFQPYAEINGRQANFIPVGGNGSTGTYYISNKGCAVPRSTAFNGLLTSSNITLDCVSGLGLGNAQKDNFGPRVGFAYRFANNLVVRGGYGIAYGALGNLGYGGTLGTNYPFVYTSTFNSPDSQHPLLLNNGQAATMEQAFTTISLGDPTINPGTGLNMYGRQYNFQTPYVQTLNLTIEDQFTNHDAVQVGYVGTLGRHLDNLGYNNSPTEILPTSANPQNFVPFPSFARNATYETTNANSNYNSLQATYQHELSQGLTLLFNYTYSRCLSDQHTQASQNQQYRAEWLPGFGIKKDYALCDIDAMHLVHFSGTYNLPFGRGRQNMKNVSAPVDAVLGGWSVNFIYTHQSGQPTTVTCPVATSEFGCFANLVPGQSPYSGPHNYTQWLNPAAFAEPPAATAIGQTSYAPLGGGGQQVYGPGFNNLDASIFKNFAINESIHLQFRAESFNFTNTPQFAQPGNLNQFTNSKGGFSAITATRAPSRRFQLALKLLF